MLPAHPHRLPPPRRLLDQPNNIGLAALPAAAALQGPAAERHRQLRAPNRGAPREIQRRLPWRIVPTEVSIILGLLTKLLADSSI